MLPDSSFRPPVVMEGRFIRLVPLEPRFADDLFEAARDPRIFRYLRYAPTDSVEAMRRLIQTFLDRCAAGTDLPFALLRRTDGRAIGMTRYLSIDRFNETVEVGGTWIPPSLWGSAVNADSKRCMLGRAFEVEHAERVQIKTDERNVRSQKAIEKLGAVREGVLRHEVVMPDGFRRSSVYYSLLASEWPAARDRLDRRLAAASPPWPESNGR